MIFLFVKLIAFLILGVTLWWCYYDDAQAYLQGAPVDYWAPLREADTQTAPE